MGIYLHGIEMPNGGYRTVEITFDADGYPMALADGGDAFDVIPVPPHGRLIDADAFAAKYIAALPGGIDDLIDKSRAPEFVSQIQALLMDIAEAPTIIPADPEEGDADG